jgi:hypothetical protein
MSRIIGFFALAALVSGCNGGALSNLRRSATTADEQLERKSRADAARQFRLGGDDANYPLYSD